MCVCVCELFWKSGSGDIEWAEIGCILLLKPCCDLELVHKSLNHTLCTSRYYSVSNVLNIGPGSSGDIEWTGMTFEVLLSPWPWILITQSWALRSVDVCLYGIWHRSQHFFSNIMAACAPIHGFLDFTFDKKMISGERTNLVAVKKEIQTYHSMQCQTWKRNLLNTLWEKVRMLVTSIFSVPQFFFYLIRDLKLICSHYDFVVCMFFF